MSVLKINPNNEEYKTFPLVLKDYASYLVAIKGNSDKTVAEYLLDLRTFFRFMKMRWADKEMTADEFEKISIKDLTLSHVQSVTSQNIIDYLMFVNIERQNSTTTRMRKLSSIKSFYKYAYSKRHLVESNPAQDVDAPQKNRVLPKYLTLDEAVSLLEAIKADTESRTTVRDYAIVVLFLNTGMRLSELVGLNLQSFDSELKTVRVIGKGKKERVIYLNDAARDATRDYIRLRLDPSYIKTGTNALFLSRRQERISAKTVQWMVNKYLGYAGLGSRGLSVHKLRHTAATLMYQTGKVDIRVLKDILGHEQLNTTQIYTHVVDRNIEEAMEKNPLAEIKIKRKKSYISDEE